MRSQAQHEAGFQGIWATFWILRQYEIWVWLAQRKHTHGGGRMAVQASEGCKKARGPWVAMG